MTAVIVLIVCAILLFLALFVLLFELIHTHKEISNHKKRVYQALYAYADENDQLLLNDVHLFLPGDYLDPTVIDHILFADKYIYIIRDFAMVGGIWGNIQDPELFAIDHKRKKSNFTNPVLQNEETVRRLEQFLKADPNNHMLVSAVVYNNSLIVPESIRRINQESWFISLGELEKTIRKEEKDDVTPIPHEMTESIAHLIRNESDSAKNRESISNNAITKSRQ